MVYKPLEHTSILSVSRQVHGEAEPVLFGNNTLSFDRTTILQEFLFTIGHRAQYIRKVRILRYGYVKTTAHATFQALSVAKGLRKLEFSHGSFCGQKSYHSDGGLTPEKIAKDVAPLLRALEKSYQERGLKGSVKDVIALYGDCCDDCSSPTAQPCDGTTTNNFCRCLCSTAKAKSKEMLATLNEAIEKVDPKKAAPKQRLSRASNGLASGGKARKLPKKKIDSWP